MSTLVTQKGNGKPKTPEDAVNFVEEKNIQIVELKFNNLPVEEILDTESPTSIWKDGIKNNLEPAAPIDKNSYTLTGSEVKKIKHVPKSLDEALAVLEKDRNFLLEGGVFTEDVLDPWIEYKQEVEIDELRLRPYPYEFYLCFNV